VKGAKFSFSLPSSSSS